MENESLNVIAEKTARYHIILQKTYLSVSEAAIYLDCAESFIRSLVKSYNGRPPVVASYSLGNKYIMVKRDDLDRYIESNIRRSSEEMLRSEVQTSMIK